MDVDSVSVGPWCRVTGDVYVHTLSPDSEGQEDTVTKDERRERTIGLLLAALPGPETEYAISSNDLSAKTGIGIGTVRRYLRTWLEEGVVDRCTKFFGSHRYTWIYWRIRRRP